MKKILLILTSMVIAFALVNCKSIDKTNVGGKTVVTASQMQPVIFTAMGAPVTACLDDLEAEGVKNVTNANGAPTGGLFIVSRLSGSEQCQATGTK